MILKNKNYYTYLIADMDDSEYEFFLFLLKSFTQNDRYNLKS